MVLTMCDRVTTRELSVEESARLLSDAVGAHLPLRVSSEDEPKAVALPGLITDITDGHLELSIDDASRAAFAAFTSDVLRIELSHAGFRYRFATRCAEEYASPATGVLRVLKPGRIVMVERRRSHRRRLQKRGKVTLRDPDNPEAWSCSALMMNLSLGGMACRIRTRDAESIDLGQTLLAVFRAGTPPEELRINSRVVTTTRAGTPDHLVVGMEFVTDEHLEAARARLEGAIRNAASPSGQDTDS